MAANGSRLIRMWRDAGRLRVATVLGRSRSETPAVSASWHVGRVAIRQWLCAFVLYASLMATALASDRAVVPDWTLKTAEGETVRLSERAHDQTTVLFFWATWCPYCKALMPHLQSIRLEYGNKVEILAINVREDGDPVEFLREQGYDFLLLVDGDAVADAYGIHGTPGLLLIDDSLGLHFDLRALPPFTGPGDSAMTNRQKAAHRAPYWAAELRKGLDQLR